MLRFIRSVASAGIGLFTSGGKPSQPEEPEEPEVVEDQVRPTETEEVISIDHLVFDCKALLHECLANPRLEAAGLRLEHVLYRLNTWESDLVVRARGRISLEHRLRFGAEIRTMVIELLDFLKRNLMRSITSCSLLLKV